MLLLESVNFEDENRDFNCWNPNSIERCNFLISHYDYSLDYIPLASFRQKSSWQQLYRNFFDYWTGNTCHRSICFGVEFSRLDTLEHFVVRWEGVFTFGEQPLPSKNSVSLNVSLSLIGLCQKTIFISSCQLSRGKKASPFKILKRSAVSCDTSFQD